MARRAKGVFLLTVVMISIISATNAENPGNVALAK
jgi:hypothetical protein